MNVELIGLAPERFLMFKIHVFSSVYFYKALL